MAKSAPSMSTRDRPLLAAGIVPDAVGTCGTVADPGATPLAAEGAAALYDADTGATAGAEPAGV